MAEKILVVWVDENIDENNSHCQEMISKLYYIIEHLIVLPNSEMCMRLVQEASREKLIIIASPSLGQQLTVDIDSMPQVVAIYVLSNSSTDQVEWTKDAGKLKGVYSNIDAIVKALHQCIEQSDESALPISFINRLEDNSRMELDQLEPSFMYTKLIKEIFLSTDYNDRDRDRQRMMEYFEHIYSSTPNPPKQIRQFIQEYQAHTAIWWYTRNSFIYETLNQALRLLDTDVLVAMGLFIHDLHRQIEQLDRAQLGRYRGKPLLVYRGQALSERDYQKLITGTGALLSFNCFLSTSLQREVSLEFALTNPGKIGIEKVLFIIRIDPTIQVAPFADISTHSQFPGEAEILFSMNTVFHIKTIQQTTTLTEVHLAMTDATDKSLSSLYRYINEQTSENSTTTRLTQLLLDLGRWQTAEDFQILSGSDNNRHFSNSNIDYFRGIIEYQRGDYTSALACFRRNLTRDFANHPDDHPTIGASYNNIAVVYYNMGEYRTALSHYNKALEMRKKALPDNHPSIAASYNNIAAVYSDMGDHRTALSHYNKALEMRKKALPDNHPLIAASYNNIAAVYYNMGEYRTALSLTTTKHWKFNRRLYLTIIQT